MGLVEVELVKEKETANTIRYVETGDSAPVVRNIYLQKWVYRQLGEPTKIKVKIEGGDKE